MLTYNYLNLSRVKFNCLYHIRPPPYILKNEIETLFVDFGNAPRLE